MAGRSPLEPHIDTAVRTRALQRVLLSAAEGTGRTHALRSVPGVPVLRVDVGAGALVSQTLRALLPPVVDDEARWHIVRVAPHLLALQPERATIAAELLGSLLGVREPGFRTARLDEQSRREGAALELARWIAERAGEHGLVLAFDDAHLADDDGVAFIEMLSQRDEQAPVCLVVSSDAEPSRATPAFRARRAGWVQEPRWAQVELPRPAEAVLREVLERAGARGERLEALLELSGGNPSLAVGLQAYWSASPSLLAKELPRSLDALRVARVRSLSENVARAATTLAVLGGRAPLAALSAVQGSYPPVLIQAISAGLVRFERVGPIEVCRFCDVRMGRSLESTMASAEVLGARVSAGVWAAQALEELDPAIFSLVAEVLVPLAMPALDGPAASLWAEAWAQVNPGRPESLARLAQALPGALGIRKLVLVRRLAEGQLFLGRPDEALALVQSAGRPGGAASQGLPCSRVGAVLEQQPRSVLDRWEKLTADEAMCGLELVRAEILSNLVKKEETQKSFAELERRLSRLDGPVVHHVWVRWAKAWSWFLCEILGKAHEAMRVCAVVRARVPAEALAADEDALAFFRAEEVATCGTGNLTLARTLTEAHIAMAQRLVKLRDECLAWNARAIVHYGQGELQASRKGFERAVELARITGWLRREAISLHNLSLVLSELGEYEPAIAAEQLYLKLSLLIGNHAAKSEAPAVLGAIELARGRFSEAEAQLTTSRRVAESNGWDMLTAVSRALAGRLRLQRSRGGSDSLEVTRGRNDLLAALERLEEQQVAWSEEIDPAEVYALTAVSMRWGGQSAGAKAMLERARARVPADNVVSLEQLQVALAWLEGARPELALSWFEQRGFVRRAALWRSLW